MRSSRSRADGLIARDVAHRGLHGGGVPENSLAAAEAAIAGGFAIECDVRLGGDATVLVFHDADTGRLCGRPGALVDADWRALRLANGEAVPTLGALLATIGGRVPLFVEIKSDRHLPVALCRGTLAALRPYAGLAAIMSFDPRIVRWFGRHDPDRPRGLVMTEHPGRRAALRRRLALCYANPDFLAYDVRCLPSALVSGFRARGRPVLSWTVRTAEDRARAAAYADRPIWEAA
ncbi:glycerophosphodiester phosphodiesterase family protein [Sphingomonas morindae]|uniref:Glycerophosphodiester phosphodiesterase n=1 Tax=Sphingomonas morindae TaxID=1541170 RepID=A0ABY4X4G9_9SPHN|nr:glycerophosphodiester phosphodiesterase family protein [Sphingomonas morindae]USI71802.1 glycerophosphodiester phosphodiesterase [Sphingomonas morindae]